MGDHDPTGRFGKMRRTVAVRLSAACDLHASWAVGEVVRSSAATVSRLEVDRVPRRNLRATNSGDCRVEHDGHRSWTVTVGTGAALSVTVPDLGADEMPMASLAIWPRLVSSPATIPDSCAILRDLVAVGVDAPAPPPRPSEDELASVAGLAADAGTPVAVWRADTSYVTVLRTTLEPDDLRDCVQLVPFPRRYPARRNPMVFALGETGHAATQQVDVTEVGIRDGFSTVVISCHVGGSGDAAVDAITAQRAYACVEALCDFIVEWDPDATPLRSAVPREA